MSPVACKRSIHLTPFFSILTDLPKRLVAAQELREYAELYQNQDFLGFIRHFVPAFVTTMQSVPPSFKADSSEQVSRSVTRSIAFVIQRSTNRLISPRDQTAHTKRPTGDLASYTQL